MDTVAINKPVCVVVKDDRIESDGSTILGGDDKGAIAAFLEALAIIKSSRISHRPIEIVLTRDEKRISSGVENLDVSLFSGREFIIPDSPEPFGTITLSAPYLFNFDVKIEGEKCHVREPEKGNSVVKIVSLALSGNPGKFFPTPLGRIDDFTTANIAYLVSGISDVLNKDGFLSDKEGILAGFKKEMRNSIPNLAIIHGEVRGAKLDVVESVLEKIKLSFELAASQFAGQFKSQAIFEAKKFATGYFLDKSDSLVSEVSGVFKKQGLEPKFYNSTGGSDANFLIERGIKSVVIGSAYRNFHRNDECVLINELVLLVDFFLKYVSV
jgi:tripeptide aminopeptidase